MAVVISAINVSLMQRPTARLRRRPPAALADGCCSLLLAQGGCGCVNYSVTAVSPNMTAPPV